MTDASTQAVDPSQASPAELGLTKAATRFRAMNAIDQRNASSGE